MQLSCVVDAGNNCDRIMMGISCRLPSRGDERKLSDIKNSSILWTSIDVRGVCNYTGIGSAAFEARLGIQVSGTFCIAFLT